VCYSGVSIADRATQRFRSLGVEWRDVAHWKDEQLDAQIRADQIDILVDLSLHTAGDRLLVFARQPAPVQVSFAGYPGETGLESIAWRLTDRHLDPPGQPVPAGMAEPFHLPDSFWCFDPPDDAPLVGKLPALGGAPFTFGCLHKFAKVNADVIALWCRILHGIPASRLLMLCPEGEARERIRAQFAKCGVAASRLEFSPLLPRREYLDTFPYNGHMTACDALWMGVPVVSLAGTLPVSRGGLSILTTAGLPGLVARTPDDYVRIAIDLASDLPGLAELRITLREKVKGSPLMDPVRFARSLEGAYRTMWHRWCERGGRA
jgi:predicted O-linked N-acetylglucosamine transferase (SPINDLY family)